MRKKIISALLTIFILGACGIPALTMPAAQGTGSPPPAGTATQATVQIAPTPTDLLGPTLPAILPLAPEVSVLPTFLSMIDLNVGWAIDGAGHIVHISVGGNIWQDATPPQGSFIKQGFFALDGEIAWATPAIPACNDSSCTHPTTSLVWQTSDGGKTWQPGAAFDLGAADDNVAYVTPQALQFLDAQTGWLLAEVDQQQSRESFRLFQTTDGGTTWVRRDDPASSPTICRDLGLAFLDAQTGWLAGHCAGVGISKNEGLGAYRSSDGGTSWVWTALPAPTDLPAGFVLEDFECGAAKVTPILPDGVGLEVVCGQGTENPATRFYYLSPDRGQTWRSWQATGDESFLNPTIGWRLFIPGSGKPNEIQRTLDGGLDWTKIALVSWPSANFSFVGDGMWAIVNSGETVTLVQSLDGGHTWDVINPKLTAAISSTNCSRLALLMSWQMENISSLAFSPDSRVLVTGNWDNAIHLWRVADGSQIRVLEGHTDWIESLAFSSDGTLLASGSLDKTIRLWRVSDGKLLRTFDDSTGRIWAIALSHDGTVLASGGEDHIVRLWRVADGVLFGKLLGHFDTVTRLAFSPDGTILASGSRDGTARLWRVADGTLVAKLEGKLAGRGGENVSFSPDGLTLITASDALRFWQIADGKLFRSFGIRGGEDTPISPDGTLLFTYDYPSGTFWQVSSGMAKCTIHSMGYAAHPTFSPDGTLLAVVYGFPRIRFWGIPSK